MRKTRKGRSTGKLYQYIYLSPHTERSSQRHPPFQQALPLSIQNRPWLKISNLQKERQLSLDPVVACKKSIHLEPRCTAEQSSYARRGKAIAIRLAEDGFDVCVNDIQTNSQGIDEVSITKIYALAVTALTAIITRSSTTFTPSAAKPLVS